MSAPQPWAKPVLAFGLLTVVLALITGVLGMHIVITGPHTMHQTAAAEARTSATAVGLHTAHGDRHTIGHTSQSLFISSGIDTTPQTQCTCSGNCSGEHVMGGSCIPSTATGSLAAPLPESTAVVPSNLQSLGVQARAAWSYIPGSPSPGDLSISRT
ncbi:hypothetical protein ACIPY2_14130 [Paenarthrobacter sp. NPDC089675]|uniref:hypothetical protein n=1 Tax=Paenarthrobacter sp. NPDC089675 TaxID=3364376 RepID=UPI0038096BFF